MNTLDRIAAVAIIFQLILTGIFGVVISGHLRTQDATLNNIQTKLYQPTMVAAPVTTESPTPSTAVKGTVPSASSGAILPLRSTK